MEGRNPINDHLSGAVEDILGPRGSLAAKWPGYENRPSQLEMALEVARAFANDDFALVEAGTGTGKTLAYLIPALLSGKKTIISTGTKNLQEQIFFKDIPFIRKTLDAPFRAAYLKGRENYLCLHHFKDFEKNPVFMAPQETVFWERIKKWAYETKTGDRSELSELPDEFITWSDLSASRDRCLGGKCPEYQDCFLNRARRNAAGADLVVVNHHLFMADLDVRGQGHGEVIPDYEAVVFDEAHQLEDIATQYFGAAVSSWRLSLIRRDIEKAFNSDKKMKSDLRKSLDALARRTDALTRNFLTKPGEYELWGDDDQEKDGLRDLGGKLAAGLNEIAVILEKEGKKSEDEILEGLAVRASTISKDFGFILDGSDRGFVFWAERRGRGLFLRASPIDITPFLQQSLYERGLSLTFTSATLTTEGSFEYFKDRMGLLPELEGLALESPYDFTKNTLLYIPRSLPFPASPQYGDALTSEIDRLLKMSRGRAFVLFTSYRNMNYVAEKLAGKAPWTCLVQGQAPRTVLLEKFRKDIHSVLMATYSFWQGVDVPGESLSAVIIDKMPFPRPDSPLIKARSQKIKDEGRDPFFHYMVPEAVITLKQGLGRLIRSEEDQGLMAVLDVRIIRKGYGKKFLKSMPPGRLTHELEDVGEFFQQGNEEARLQPDTP